MGQGARECGGKFTRPECEERRERETGKRAAERGARGTLWSVTYHGIGKRSQATLAHTGKTGFNGGLRGTWSMFNRGWFGGSFVGGERRRKRGWGCGGKKVEK